MNAQLDIDWAESNKRALEAELDRLSSLLRTFARGGARDEDAPSAAGIRTTLDVLCERFGLSEFERNVLLLAAGVELDADIAALCAELHGAPRRAHATFGLALAALPDAHWSALAPDAPLRHWDLVKLAQGAALAAAPLAIDERILHFLVGVACDDPRLDGIARRLLAAPVLAPSQLRQAERLAEIWRDAEVEPPCVLIDGDDLAAARGATAYASAALGLELLAVRADDLPAAPAERAAITRALARECLLRRAALLVECDGAAAAARVIADAVRAPLAVLGAEIANLDRPMLRVRVHRPEPAEQRALWRELLGTPAEHAEAEIAQLGGHYRLGVAQLRDAALEARAAARRGMPLEHALARACRESTRGPLDALATRIEPRTTWEDLVLPEPQLATLRDIVRQLRHRSTVYERWGFAARSSRGLGLAALFAGESGTGKTLAAEVLAAELGLDLYRIDLAAVVSKYIGETEKNLKRVFDAAEASGAVLLFDEADALFGRRSSVKDSHDRYANIELAYLLQRIEAYRGLAILTTNMKALLDPAFLRRIRFVVHFPFPDAASRARIWERMLPDSLPRDGVDVAQLAQLNVAGGNARNIALNAAFYAADEGVPLAMCHLLRAAQAEYAKLERPLTQTEARGWQ